MKPKVIEHPIVSTITNEIPVIRSVSNYWRETIRQSRDKRLSEFLTNISERIAALEDSTSSKLEKEHLGSEDYFITIEQLTEFAIKTNDENKIEYLKKFAINYSKNSRPDITLKDLYLSLVNQLSGMHFIILSSVYTKQCNLSAIDLIALLDIPDRNESICLSEICDELNVDKDYVLTILYSLNSYGLIKMKFNKLSNPFIVLEPIGLKLMDFLNG